MTTTSLYTHTYTHSHPLRWVGVQTIKHKMAELKTDIAVGRAFTDQCLELHAQGNQSPPSVLSENGAVVFGCWM